MKLESIHIESFRSIINQQILVKDNCIGLIGLNESGKTNILNVLNHINSKEIFISKDKSKITNDLPSIKYHFVVDKKSIEKIKEELENEIRVKTPFVGEASVISKLDINSIIVSKSVRKNEKSEYKTEYELEVDYDFLLNKKYQVFVSNEELPDNHLIKYNDSEYTVLTSYFHIDIIEKENVKYFKSIEEKNLTVDVESIIKSIISQLIPQVKYWEYNSKYLIPSELTYVDFMANGNPYENNAPLYNMLLISDELGIYDKNDLKNKISEWSKDSSVRRKDSNILTRDINKHIKNIWKDYDQELKIELEETKVTIHVNDPNSSVMNYYDMGDRSQGFKSFMSFILTISAEVKTGVLENYLLILDEPETHLHPSGVKYMKEELLKLSLDNNYVFFATHSIFMIDRANLKRHIVVTKQGEYTKLSVVNRNNILQEDVIFQALGTSVDEFSLSNSNILFEGELDVKIFSFFIDKCIPKKDNKLIDHRFLDGGGTKRILKFFTDKSIPSKSKWTIILDNDSPGRNLPDSLKKNTIEEVYKNFDFIYYSKENDFELEDILPVELIQKSIATAILDKELTHELDLNQSKPVSKIIEEFYGRNRFSTIEKKSIEEKFKIRLDIEVDSILKKISRESSIDTRLKKFKELLPEYYDFLKHTLQGFEMTMS